MRVSVLAAALAVVSALPATALPQKVGRCVPKRSASSAPAASASASASVSEGVSPSASLAEQTSITASPSSEPSASSSATSESSVASSSTAESSEASPSPSSSTEATPSSTESASSSASETSSVSSEASPSSSEPSPSPSSTPTPSATGVLNAPEDKADGSSDAFRDQIVQLHNQVRAQLNATDLVWDQSLGDSAAEWVDQCRFGDSGNQAVSENIAAGQGSNMLPYLFSQWAQEASVYDMDNPGLTGTNGGQTGHFTALVWKSSTNIGCAWKACPAGNIQEGWTGSATYLVCQYSPPGNYAPKEGDGTKQSFCENVGCSDAARASISLTDSVQGTTVE